YGACCVDDITAQRLGVDLLVHYGHSCLVPITQTTSTVKVLYVFVDIKIDPKHFFETLKLNFPVTKKLALVSTVQFLATLHAVADDLKCLGYEVTLPQSKPLSAGEILGCTAPEVPSKCCDVLVYLGDGRFHLEAAMIANPRLEAYKYDPYEKKFTREYYDHDQMLEERKRRVDECSAFGTFGVIMGTLGRQGNPLVVERLRARLEAGRKRAVVILLSEIFPKKLDLFGQVDGFVQVACPRLSIDWG
nr:putative diphthamide biosynthesis protein 1 [Cucujiformia]